MSENYHCCRYALFQLIQNNGTAIFDVLLRGGTEGEAKAMEVTVFALIQQNWRICSKVCR